LEAAFSTAEFPPLENQELITENAENGGGYEGDSNSAEGQGKDVA
jgi:hypothetical protein